MPSRLPDPVERAELELRRARDGLQAHVSVLAASVYLNVSTRTLQDWRSRNEPPEFVKSGQGPTSKVFYPWDRLVAFAQRLTMPLSQRTDEEELERLRQQQAQAELRDELDRLRRASGQATARLKRRERQGDQRMLGFAFADVTLPEPWVLHGDRLAGHLFELDEAAQLDALDQGWVEALSLADALQRPWTQLDERKRWHDAFIGAMNEGIEQAEAWQATARDDALGSAWSDVPGVPTGGTRHPF